LSELTLAAAARGDARPTKRRSRSERLTNKMKIRFCTI